MFDRDSLDFNEVFFTDVRVPAQNLVGPLNGGWQVANGSLGHERTMMWMAFANRLEQLLEDYRPVGALNRDRYATIAMDYQALRLLGSVALGQAARGERDVPGVSVLKVLGSEAEQNASRHALDAAGVDGLRSPALTARYNALQPRPFHWQLVRPLHQHLRGNHRGRHVRDSAQHHRAASSWSALTGCTPARRVR